MQAKSLFAVSLLALSANLAACSASPEPEPTGETGPAITFEEFEAKVYREEATGVYIVDRDMAIDAVASGKADLVAFGVPFLANPDLPRRLRENAPLNTPDQKTFYGGGAEGYTDYPALD